MVYFFIVMLSSFEYFVFVRKNMTGFFEFVVPWRSCKQNSIQKYYTMVMMAPKQIQYSQSPHFFIKHDTKMTSLYFENIPNKLVDAISFQTRVQVCISKLTWRASFYKIVIIRPYNFAGKIFFSIKNQAQLESRSIMELKPICPLKNISMNTDQPVADALRVAKLMLS